MKIELYVMDSDIASAERIALKMDSDSPRPINREEVLASALIIGMQKLQEAWKDEDPEYEMEPSGERDEMDIARDWLIAQDEERQ